jgi:preprotein translocase subunit SecG
MDFKLILTILFLILILALVSFNFTQESSDDSNLNETSDDVAYIWMKDDDGDLKLIPTTDTHFEGSASAPG